MGLLAATAAAGDGATSAAVSGAAARDPTGMPVSKADRNRR
jgi:hypothetical protein